MVRPGTLDEGIVYWVHGRNEYRLPDQFPPGTVVIDVGAHIGAFSLAAVDRGAQYVIAVEALAENRVLATMNMRAELANGQVELIFAAVADPRRTAVTMGPAEHLDGQLKTATPMHSRRPGRPPSRCRVRGQCEPFELGPRPVLGPSPGRLI